MTDSESEALRNAIGTAARRNITMPQALGFGIGDFFGGGQLTLITTYLSLFWTRFCGMDIATSQSVIGMSALVSAVAALLFGVLDDNLYRYDVGLRFGRRRFLLMLTAPLLLFGVFLWIPGQPFAVYVVTYVLWVVLVQVFATAYSALPGEMTTDFVGRTKLSTVRMFISTGATTVIPLAGGAMLAVFGESTPTGYMVFAIGITVLFAAAVFVCWRRTWEMTPEAAGFGAYASGEVRDGHVGALRWLRRCVKVFREYATTLRLNEFRRHLSIYLLVQMSMDVFGQTFVFFVVFDWGSTAAFASLLLGCAAISLPLMPLFGIGMNKLGPRRMYAINFAGCLVGVGLLLAVWITAGRLPSVLWTVFAVVSSLWFFAFKSLCAYLPWTVFPYMADVDQVVTRRYRSATFAAIQASFRQLCSGIAPIAVGLVLGAVGFDATKSVQVPSARIGVGAVLLGWFGLAMVVCWLISARLRIDKKTDGIVLSEIGRLSKGGSKASVSDETRRTIEKLTGMPYDQVWINGAR